MIDEQKPGSTSAMHRSEAMAHSLHIFIFVEEGGCMRKGGSVAHSAMAAQLVPASEIAAFIDSQTIDDILAPWLPDVGERAMIVRCLLDVGPAHHRGSNYVLLRLLGLLLKQHGMGPNSQQLREMAPIRLRVPPTVDTTSEPAAYPLGIPTAVIERLAPHGSRAWLAMIDCLSDGPPQHSLANAAMLLVIDALLRASERTT